MSPFTLPPGYSRIKRVINFDELVTTPFGGGFNSLCQPRTLPGDFGSGVDITGRIPGSFMSRSDGFGSDP